MYYAKASQWHPCSTSSCGLSDSPWTHPGQMGTNSVRHPAEWKKKKTFCWKQRRGAKRRVESHRHRGQRLQQSLPQKWMRKQISASGHWVNRLCVISQRVADKKRRWWVPFLVYLLRVCLQLPLPPLLSSLCFFFFFFFVRWGEVMMSDHWLKV